MQIKIPVKLEGFLMDVTFFQEEIDLTQGEEAFGVLIDQLRAQKCVPAFDDRPVPGLPPATQARAAAPPAQQQQAAPAGVQGRYADRTASGSAGGWVCPVHGQGAPTGAGWQGRGTECKVNTNNPDQDDPNADWIRVDQEGYPKPDSQGRFWCRMKASQAGGGGYGGGNRGGGGYNRGGGRY